MEKQVQKWADVAMFTAAPIDVAKGPEVQLLSCNSDPLGTIASAAKMYKGEYVKDLSEITDDERRFYLSDVRKNVLAAPLEFVNFHFIIHGVTRGFTHQMVRQRTATYCQESTRFAVKEDVPVGLPPSLTDTVPWDVWLVQCSHDLFPDMSTAAGDFPERVKMVTDYANTQATKEQQWRRIWDDMVGDISDSYNALVNAGMPAEDARGILPTNLLTRINYNTSLRGLLEHSGLRLCTQAQFEWKLVWRKIIQAIQRYGHDHIRAADRWQFNELATLFKPICYKTGKCEFMSEGDRFCAIRGRVQDFHEHGIASSNWGNEPGVAVLEGTSRVLLPPIKDYEWMNNQEAARISQ